MNDWTDELVRSSRLPVVDVPFVAVGGGLATFCVVKLLRVAGVGSRDIAVLTPDPHPYGTFRGRALASQMDDGDPIRSDSSSRIDNPWGFPGYAVEEAVRRRRWQPLARVVGEPVLCAYYTPRGGDVYDGLDREAARVGWSGMVARGWVTLIRRRVGGGYFVALTTRRGGTVLFRCRYAHLGIGYPAPRLAPDLRTYRARTGDTARAVHVYEPHEHVYAALRDRGGRVVVRGAGIAASRVLERLVDDRDSGGRPTEIVQLVRPDPEGTAGGPRWQPFSFPKGAFGGQLAARYASLGPEGRADMVRRAGRTSTAPRRRWREQLARGEREGWYRCTVARPVNLRSSRQGDGLRLDLEAPDGSDPDVVDTDFLVDATGLEGDACRHWIIEDLVASSGATLNRLGRLATTDELEVTGARSGWGRLYVSGAPALGGPVLAPDSFFGLNEAALRICDALAAQGFCTRIGPRRSVRAWWAQMREIPL